MYVKQPPPNHLGDFGDLGEFGIIVQGIVAAVQGVTLGVANAIEYSATKKYLKTEQHTVRRAGAEALQTKQEELALREAALRAKGQEALLSDESVKKLVIIGSVTAVSLSILGIAIYYILAVGGDDE